MPDSVASGCHYCGGAGCGECGGTGERYITFVEVDGESMVVHGSRPLSESDRAALAEAYRAAMERMNADA